MALALMEMSKLGLLTKWSGIYVLILLGIAAVGWAISNSYQDVVNFSGTDLRARIIGARLLSLDKNPYTFQWDDSQPVQLIDPDGRYPGPSRTTYTPALLALYIPFAGLEYHQLRLLSWVAEWIAFAGVAAICFFMVRKDPARLGSFFLVVVAIAASYFWRLHMERGQYYVILALLVSLDIHMLMMRRFRAYSGYLIGIAAALRPTMILAAPLFWLIGERRTAVNLCISAALFIGLTTLNWGPGIWLDYMQNIRAWEALVLDPGALDRIYGASTTVLPSVIEGTAFGKTLPPHSANVTVLGAMAKFPALHDLANIVNLLLLGSVLLIGFFLCYVQSRLKLDLEERITLVLVILLTIDFMVPIRFSYADVMFLPLFAVASIYFTGPDRRLALAPFGLFILCSLPMMENLRLVSHIRPGISIILIGLLVTRSILRAWSGLPPQPADKPATPLSA